MLMARFAGRVFFCLLASDIKITLPQTKRQGFEHEKPCGTTLLVVHFHFIRPLRIHQSLCINAAVTGSVYLTEVVRASGSEGMGRIRISVVNFHQPLTLCEFQFLTVFVTAFQKANMKFDNNYNTPCFECQDFF